MVLETGLGRAAKEFLIGMAGITLAMAAGAIVILARGQDPIAAYEALFLSAAGTLPDLLTSLNNSIPLILTGLSAALAFGSGAINLGQQGQFLFGAMATALAGMYLPLPRVPALVVGIAAALSFGALWAWLAAWLKVRHRMDEFITTLMLNFVALFFTTYLISYPLMDPEAYTPMTIPIRPEAQLLPLTEMSELNSGVFLVIVVIALVWAFARYTRRGYEWKMVGLNPLFARLGGVDTARTLTGVMLVGGALAGFAGGLAVMGGVQHRFVEGISANYAWDGIMVAIIAKNGILGTVLYGLFFGALQSGSLGLEFAAGVPSEFITVLESLIVLLVIASNVVLQRVVIRLGTSRTSKGGRAAAGSPEPRHPKEAAHNNAYTAGTH